MRVAIAGGGIGGLTLGRALAERGVQADVYEQAGELREIGAAVALSANGVRELERLGLGEGLAAISTQPSSLCIRRSDGTLICREPMGEGNVYPEAFGSAYYGVHRVPLLKLLAEGLDPDRIHLAHRVTDASEDGRLRFENGTERDGAFAALPTDLAWIHGHDARGTAEADRHGNSAVHA